jgi:hypothetical protein
MSRMGFEVSSSLIGLPYRFFQRQELVGELYRGLQDDMRLDMFWLKLCSLRNQRIID